MVKYEYEFKKSGPKEWIVVYQVTDGVDSTIYTGVPSFSTNESVLLNEAKLALGQNFTGQSPNINLILRGVTPPGPTQSVPISVTQSVPEIIVPPEVIDPIPQPVSKEEAYGTNEDTNKNTNGRFPGINNIFKPSISLPPIEIDLGNQSESEKKFMVDGLGTYPFVWYNGYNIDYRYLNYLEIYTEGIVPRLKLTFSDNANIIKSKGFPLDDTRVRVFLNSRSKNLRSIYMEFKILEFKHLGGIKYTLIGSMAVDGLYTRKYASFNGKTSNSTLQEFCKKIGIGFNSNIEDTDDKMTWINSAEPGYQFMEDVILNSYISDTSFLTGFIDYYYNFNYIDIEKEILRDNSNDQGIDTSGINQSQLGKDTDESIIPLVLSTDKASQNSSIFIGKSRVHNDSTSISLRKGYKQIAKFYNMNKKEYLVFNIDSITSKDNKSIILKGAPQDNSFFNENSTVLWSGSLNTDNSHKNFNYSITQNRQNLDDICKIHCDLELPNPNYNLYKFLKVEIMFVEPTKTPTSTDIYLTRLSGSWIIIDIKYVFSGGKMKQVVKAVKRELGMSPDEIETTNQDQTASPANQNSQNNLNPTDAEPSTNLGTTSSTPVVTPGPTQSEAPLAPTQSTATQSVPEPLVIDIRFLGQFTVLTGSDQSTYNFSADKKVKSEKYNALKVNSNDIRFDLKYFSIKSVDMLVGDTWEKHITYNCSWGPGNGQECEVNGRSAGKYRIVGTYDDYQTGLKVEEIISDTFTQ